MFEPFAASASPEALIAKLEAVATALGDEAFAKRLAHEILAQTRPEEAIPEPYARYRAVVRDGIEFFLVQVNRKRLVALAASQLQLNPAISPQERLVELAKQFPTLHKLGQFIARNPNLDPGVKKWLIHLENGIYGTSSEGIVERIGRQALSTDRGGRVQIQPPMLSEASVGAVMRFRWYRASSPEPIEGVFKVLKPGIRRRLGEELVILAKTAAFFESNRRRYPFRDFRFLEVFQEVRSMLAHEIDLTAEQTYLAEAMDFYSDMAAIQIPQRLPFSTETMTAMAYLRGPKITDAVLKPRQAERLAGVLFEALVCRPLFGRQASSLFHGDPHAGNILVVEDPDSGELRIGLLDWTLAGHLKRSDRVKTAQLMQAVIKMDLGSIHRAIKALTLSAPWDGAAPRNPFRELIRDLVNDPAFGQLSQIKKTFKLLEELAYDGFVFPADLMLFRKAIFTLEGVIHDLFPLFDMDAAVIRYLTTLIASELPSRIGNLFYPLADKPENYPSLISNYELQSLLVHQYIEAVGAGYRTLGRYLLDWGRVF
jgi:ubiquinone biosynthesis protein